MPDVRAAFSFDSHIKKHKILGAIKRVSGIDIKYTRQRLKEWLISGEKLTRGLQEKLFSSRTQTRLREERNLRLHALAPWLLHRSLQISKQEEIVIGTMDEIAERTIDEIAEGKYKKNAAEKKEQAKDKIHEEFKFGIWQFDEQLKRTVEWVSYMLNESRIDELVNCDEYLTGLTLNANRFHSFAMIWEASAQNLRMLEEEPSEYLEFFNINNGFESIADVLTLTSHTYRQVEKSLEIIAEKNKGHSQGILAEEGRKFVKLNRAGITDFAIHWPKHEDILAYCGRKEVVNKIKEQLESLPAVFLSYEEAVSLLREHRNHIKLARNILYFGLRDDNVELILLASNHIADVLNIPTEKRSEIYTKRLAGEDPLNATHSYVHDKIGETGLPLILSSDKRGF